MKQLNLIRQLVFFVFLGLLSVRLQAQSVIIHGQLNGEPVLSTDNIYIETDPNLHTITHSVYAVTGNHIYVVDNDYIGFDFLIQGGYFQTVWSPPAGTTIRDVKVKRDTSGLVTSVLTLLTNGSVYKTGIEYSPPYTQLLGQIVDTVSQTFQKVVGDDIYVLSTSHLYVTRDQGTSWQLDDPGIAGFKYDVAIDTGQNVFLLTDSGLLKQTPHGTSWSRVAASHAGTNVFVDRRDRILTSGLYSNALYLSNDDGATWNMDTVGLYPYLVKKMADDAYGNLYVVAYNLSTYPPHDMVFRSLGGTAPWQEVDAGLNALIGGPFSINCMTGDSALVLGTGFGFFYATDSGTNWGINNRGIKTGALSTLVKQNNGRLVTTGPLGAYVIDVNDTAWHKTFPVASYDAQVYVYGDSTSGTLYCQDQGNIPTYYQSSLLYKSTNNGDTWALDTAGLYNLKANNMYVDERGNQYLSNSSYGSTQHAAIYTRTPGGGTWTLDSAGIPWVSYATVTSICSDHQGYLYASISLGSGNYPIMRQPVTGGTWVTDTAGIPAGTYIRYLAGQSATGVVASNGSAIYRRTSGGRWVVVPMPSQLSSPSVIAMSIDGNGAIFASFTDNNHSYGDGVFFTTNNGSTWTYAGLQDLYVEHLISYGDTTYALTYDSWGYQLTETAYNGIIEPIVNPSPVRAFPNPSQSGTWTISIPDEWIGSRLEVSDMNGRVVYAGMLDRNACLLSLYECGAYIAHVDGSKGRATVKLVR